MRRADLARATLRLLELAEPLDADRTIELCRQLERYRGTGAPRAQALDESVGRSSGIAGSPTEADAFRSDPAVDARKRLETQLARAVDALEQIRAIHGEWMPTDLASRRRPPSCSACSGTPAHNTDAAGTLDEAVPLCRNCRRFVVKHRRLPSTAELARPQRRRRHA